MSNKVTMKVAISEDQLLFLKNEFGKDVSRTVGSIIKHSINIIESSKKGVIYEN